MNEDFQIKLSSKEVLTLAALLGYKSIFGVKDGGFFKRDANINPLIRQCVRRLERKKLIQYDLSGILYIAPVLKKAIDCICNAESVGLFSTNLKSGKKSSTYIMESKNTVVLLERSSNDNYSICLTDTVPLKKVIPREILSSHHSEIHEIMLFEEAEYIHNQIASFNHEQAETRIQKHINDSKASKIITKILAGNCGYMSVQIYAKDKNLYKTVYNTLLVCIDNHTISLHLDENNVLRFESLSPTMITGCIGSKFKLSAKRGIV